MVVFHRMAGAAVAITMVWVGGAHAQEPDAPKAEHPWVTLSSLPEPAADLKGGAVNGKLYLFGGRDGVRPKNRALAYDPATATWAALKPMPVATYGSAIAAYGDKIYLFGGFKLADKAAGWQPSDQVWKYDPEKDEWSPLAALPTARGGAAAAVADGKIYLFGGATVSANSSDVTIQPKRRHTVLGTVEAYDPKTNSWHARAALPTPRNHAMVATVGGKIYVIGGRIASAFAQDGSDTDVVEAYDPARNLWSRPLERMPLARSAASVAMWRNRIVVAGGETSSTTGVAASGAVETYDPEKNQWTALPPLPEARRGMAAGLVGDRFYLAGGVVAAPASAAVAATASPAAEAQPPASASLQALQLDVVN
jgi:N-acetylneuraminic acid mutarotase